MAYSIDLRRKVLSVREAEGLTITQVLTRFCVGIAKVLRWLKRIEPQLTRIKPATKIDRIVLARDVREHPDAYLHERARRLGVSVQGIAMLCDAWASHIAEATHGVGHLAKAEPALMHPKANVAARHVFQQKIAAYEAEARTIGGLVGKLLLTVGLFSTNVNTAAFIPGSDRTCSPSLP